MARTLDRDEVRQLHKRPGSTHGRSWTPRWVDFCDGRVHELRQGEDFGGRVDSTRSTFRQWCARPPQSFEMKDSRRFLVTTTTGNEGFTIEVVHTKHNRRRFLDLAVRAARESPYGRDDFERYADEAEGAGNEKAAALWREVLELAGPDPRQDETDEDASVG